jgi:hypothetical protein
MMLAKYPDVTLPKSRAILVSPIILIKLSHIALRNHCIGGLDVISMVAYAMSVMMR